MPADKSFKMIVFDKDGTLGNDKASLVRWVQHMTQQLEKELIKIEKTDNATMKGIPAMVERFHSALGYVPSPNKIDRESSGSFVPNAPVACATWECVLEICSMELKAMGIVDPSVKMAHWNDGIKNLHAHDPPLIDDLPALMGRLKNEYGFQIAICTSDDRSSTDSSIRNWNLKDLVNYSICGDEVTSGKPSAEPLLCLCKQAGVKPSECIVVGDTTSDTGMGKNAGAGLVIGVLSGTGTKEHLLATGATVVLEDIGRIPGYLESAMSNKVN